MVSPADQALFGGHVGDYKITRHALVRMKEFGLDKHDIRGLLLDYECRYAQSDRGPDVYMHQRGEWACVVDEARKAVVTVLRRKKERWHH